MYTANTMAGSFKALGISLLGSSTMANPDHEKANSADRSTRVLVNAVEQHLKPKDIVRGNPSKTPWHWMATGGSTNAEFHYLAIARAAGVDWELDDFERVRQQVPTIRDLKPSGDSWQ
jgi:dihydroxy-acid dehydratase